MEKFRIWYLTYQNEITWFLIGWLFMAFFENLGRGNYVTALVDALLAYFNFYMWRHNRV